MLKPDQVRYAVNPVLNPAHMQDLESQFDAAIRAAESSGLWPATVPAVRDEVSLEEIGATCSVYRALGWHVSTHGKHRAIITHPSQGSAG